MPPGKTKPAGAIHGGSKDEMLSDVRSPSGTVSGKALIFPYGLLRRPRNHERAFDHGGYPGHDAVRRHLSELARKRAWASIAESVVPGLQLGERLWRSGPRRSVEGKRHV